MPGSFDDLKIDGNGHLSPKGPLEVPKDQNNPEVYAWVMQAQPDGTGAFIKCEGEPTFDRTAWATKAGTEEHKGNFKPGPAIATGSLVAKTSTGESTVFWWSVQITLT